MRFIVPSYRKLCYHIHTLDIKEMDRDYFIGGLQDFL